VVVDGGVKEHNEMKILFGVEWRSALRKALTGPTLLEMSGKRLSGMSQHGKSASNFAARSCKNNIETAAR
jgi:hypothetical protein